MKKIKKIGLGIGLGFASAAILTTLPLTLTSCSEPNLISKKQTINNTPINKNINSPQGPKFQPLNINTSGVLNSLSVDSYLPIIKNCFSKIFDKTAKITTFTSTNLTELAQKVYPNLNVQISDTSNPYNGSLNLILNGNLTFNNKPVKLSNTEVSINGFDLYLPGSLEINKVQLLGTNFYFSNNLSMGYFKTKMALNPQNTLSQMKINFTTTSNNTENNSLYSLLMNNNNFLNPEFSVSNKNLVVSYSIKNKLSYDSTTNGWQVNTENNTVTVTRKIEQPPLQSFMRWFLQNQSSSGNGNTQVTWNITYSNTYKNILSNISNAINGTSNQSGWNNNNNNPCNITNMFPSQLNAAIKWYALTNKNWLNFNNIPQDKNDLWNDILSDLAPSLFTDLEKYNYPTSFNVTVKKTDNINGTLSLQLQSNNETWDLNLQGFTTWSEYASNSSNNSSGSSNNNPWTSYSITNVNNNINNGNNNGNSSTPTYPSEFGNTGIFMKEDSNPIFASAVTKACGGLQSLYNNINSYYNQGIYLSNNNQNSGITINNTPKIKEALKDILPTDNKPVILYDENASKVSETEFISNIESLNIGSNTNFLNTTTGDTASIAYSETYSPNSNFVNPNFSKIGFKVDTNQDLNIGTVVNTNNLIIQIPITLFFTMSNNQVVTFPSYLDYYYPQFFASESSSNNANNGN